MDYLIDYQDQIRLKMIEIDELNAKFKRGNDGQINFVLLSAENERLNALVNEKNGEVDFLKNQLTNMQNQLTNMQNQLAALQQFHRDEKEQLTSNIENQVRNEIVKSKAIHQHEKMTMSAAIDDKAQKIKDFNEENQKLVAQLNEKQKENENLSIQIANLVATIQGLRHEVEINTRSILVRYDFGYDFSMRFIRIEKFKN